MSKTPYLAQSQLTFPLLETLYDLGPSAPKDVYYALADTLQMTNADVNRTTAGGVRAWDRHVRWTEQQTRQRHLTHHPRRNRWALDERGQETLQMARPGVITVVLRRPHGEVVWAESLPVIQGLPPSSVDLFLTSPPYLLRRAKAYGGPRSEREYVAWLLPFAEAMHQALRDTGSLVLNLGLGPYLPGVPVHSPIVHRVILTLIDQLGFYLAGEHAWVNPATLPAPAEWVTKRRIQLKDGWEHLLWFSKTPWPKADNRRVLVPYSKAQKRLQQIGWKPAQRPSGHHLSGDMSKDHGGAIPSRVLVAANTTSNDAYARYCRAQDLPMQPARFPPAIPEFWVRYLTEPHDLVIDPFAGSLTTAAVADRLDRRWIAIERSKTYIDGGVGRWAV